MAGSSLSADTHGTEFNRSETHRKSILVTSRVSHGGNTNLSFQNDDDKCSNGSVIAKPSSRQTSFQLPYIEESPTWIYLFCQKCYGKEVTDAWEPEYWPKLCPYPFCPSYRKTSRIFALILIFAIIWGLAYIILGKTAAPGGELFSLALLCIAAHLGGWLVSLVMLPSLVGMLVTGILLQNLKLINIDENLSELCTILRKHALVIIMIRAGLDLDPSAMKKLYLTVIRLGMIPWLVELLVIGVSTYFILGLPWKWGFMLGAIIAAVAPAIIVSCLFRLRKKGYGVSKGIPTLLIAVSGIDDAASVAMFGIILNTVKSTDLTFAIIQGPLSIIIGTGYGLIWGTTLKYVPERNDPYLAHLRILLLLFGGLISVFGSEAIGLSGAGPLGCIVTAFVAGCHWSQQGWDIENNPVATAFEIFWIIFEPILFGITGTVIKFDEMDKQVASLGAGCIALGVVVRILVTIVCSIRAQLNLKEKVFIALAWMAKAIVPAALGPVAVDLVRHSDNEEDLKSAEVVQLVSVIAIILTAPIGAGSITLTGTRLLTKTSLPPKLSEWRRRSHRPSIRDITIGEEEQEKEEEQEEKS